MVIDDSAVYGMIDSVTGKCVDTGTKKDMKFQESIAQEKVNIRANYDLIKQVLKKYLDMREDYYSLVALWIIGTYLHKGFTSYPYLFFNAMRGSGKSRIEKLIAALSRDGLYCMSPTESVLFRTTGTLCLDEIESIGSKEKQAVREILNASYKKGVTIMRMKKKKVLGSEEQVVEYFEPYRPICMANIWGMEEVLADRSITLILEKSNDPVRTRLMEDFEENEVVLSIKANFSLLLDDKKCSLCNVVTQKNIYKRWNDYIQGRYNEDDVYIYNTVTTLNHTNNITTEKLEEIRNDSLFNRVHDSGILGRNLELFMPIFIIADIVSPEVLEQTLKFAKESTSDKRTEEENNSMDVMVYDFVSKMDNFERYRVKDLVSQFKSFTDEGADWLNPKWFGRALKRLNLVIESSRDGRGIKVMLNTTKAKEKLKLFKRDDNPNTI